MKNQLPAAAAFVAGAAQVKITPPLGVELAGYFHKRFAKRVRDDLYARALVIGNRDTAVALVSCDLGTIHGEVTGPAKKQIAKECGIAPEQVLICATHNHTGPEVRTGIPMLPTVRDEKYVKLLPGRIARASLRRTLPRSTVPALCAPFCKGRRVISPTMRITPRTFPSRGRKRRCKSGVRWRARPWWQTNVPNR